MPKSETLRRRPSAQKSTHTGPRPSPTPAVNELTDQMSDIYLNSGVPAWVRTDWVGSPLGTPCFAGTQRPELQIRWAAKNATVAIHDAFAAGSWSGIADRRKAVHLAVCDVVLQRRDDDLAADGGHGVRPYYHEWKVARDQDITEVFALVCVLYFGADTQARRDLEHLAECQLNESSARSLCWSALHACFEEREDVANAPPEDEELISVDIDGFGEFAPTPGVLPRYGVLVLAISVGNEADEGDVAREADAWMARNGDFSNMFDGKGIHGLPRYPPGTPLSVPDWVEGSKWTVAPLVRQPRHNVPSLAEVNEAIRRGKPLTADWRPSRH